MKKGKNWWLYGFIMLLFTSNVNAQNVISDCLKLEKAYSLAVNTVGINIRDGVIAAGAQYGSEWTRDIGINVWNGVCLTHPSVAEKSLWAATVNKIYVGHQYWDKIIWIEGAWQYYLASGDRKFLKQAYRCGRNTLKILEDSVYDKKSELFMGPSVFNDGISGYEEPIYDPHNKSSYVLDHKNAPAIKCLSTNAIYYLSYLNLNKMHIVLYGSEEKALLKKAARLKTVIRNSLFDANACELYYLIDHKGDVHKFQEGLGLSFAILSGIINQKEAQQVCAKAWKSKWGIPSIYPNFKRFSTEKPGRHNLLIWPMVNGFYAEAALKAKVLADFDREFNGLIDLAIDADKGNYDFYEIYNPSDGKPFGGWQCKHTWESLLHQTWSATAFLRTVYSGLLGINMSEKGIQFQPYLPENVHYIKIDKLTYRGKELTVEVKGKGHHMVSLTVNQKQYATDAIIQSSGEKINVSIVVN